jgi:hypothetical protein
MSELEQSIQAFEHFQAEGRDQRVAQADEFRRKHGPRRVAIIATNTGMIDALKRAMRDRWHTSGEIVISRPGLQPVPMR